MKRYAKIITGFLVIVALMVDSVGACWLLRRARCRPCWTPCYSAPVAYDSCGMPAGAMGPGGIETFPAPMGGGEGTTIMSPSMRIPWSQPQPSLRQPLPTPAEPRPSLQPAPRTMERTEPMPRDTAPSTAPADRTETRREPMPEPAPTREREPMPARPFDNPFDRPAPAESPAIEPRDTVPAPSETQPMPRPTEPDDPFAPRPAQPERTAPAERTPADDPFAPRDSAPPSRPATDDPFGSRPSAATPPGNPFEKAADTASPMDDPFAPKSSETKSTADDPFALPADAAKSPMSEVKEAPMRGAGDASKEAEPAAEPPKESAKQNPFAEPAGPQLSNADSAPEPADAMRVWTDVTGKHQIRGQMKLILIAEHKVRILKQTGKYTTVPFAKLSEADRQFVARHAADPSALLAGRQ